MEKKIKSYLENYEHGMESYWLVSVCATLIGRSRFPKTAHALWRTYYKNQDAAVSQIYGMAGVEPGFSVA